MFVVARPSLCATAHWTKESTPCTLPRARTNQMATTFAAIQALFLSLDLDLADVQENLDAAGTEDEKIGILLGWMNHQAYDDDWKQCVDPSLLDAHIN